MQDLHMSPLQSQDAEVADWLQREDRRQGTTLTLIASENHSSAAVRETGSSRLTDKYAEGVSVSQILRRLRGRGRDRGPGARTRQAAVPGRGRQRAAASSGTTANLSALMALAGANGRIVGMSLKDGGHLSHGHPKSHTGMLFDPVNTASTATA